MSDRHTLIALQRKVAQTEDPDKVAALQARIDDLTEDPETGDTGDEDDGSEDLNRLKKAELVEMAETLDVDVTGMTKSEIIEVLGEQD